MKQLSARNGLTLIELLVSLAVISILLTVGVAGYNKYNQRQILSQAASELKSNLRLVQDKAIIGEKSASCTVSLDGWYITFTATNYQFYGKCGSLQFSSKTISLHSGVQISSPPPELRFKPLGQGVDGIDEITRNRTITLTGYGLTEQVIISVFGDIQ